ncbi:MAG: PAAR domain-containing protein [Selenomonadaceae bacterium]|nr:PAAR domain-containing protein [Selenomonadaceae bacterium]MBR4384119.1 PAAR domain-containing protein [Selenomonadaceae bacterium]
MQATRLGDVCSGHDSCPPRPLVEGSPNVYINGAPAGRVGDMLAAHGCFIHPAHTGVIASGSSKVYINGRPAGRVGDPVSCGSVMAQGSPNVIIGG